MVVSEQKPRVAVFACLRVGEVNVGIEAADDVDVMVGFAQDEVHLRGLVGLDVEELTVGQGSAVFQSSACREDVIAFVQWRGLLKGGEHHAVIDARVLGIVRQEAEAVAVKLLDAEMGVVFRISDRGDGVVVDV